MDRTKTNHVRWDIPYPDGTQIQNMGALTPQMGTTRSGKSYQRYLDTLHDDCVESESDSDCSVCHSIVPQATNGLTTSHPSSDPNTIQAQNALHPGACCTRRTLTSIAHTPSASEASWIRRLLQRLRNSGAHQPTTSSKRR